MVEVKKPQLFIVFYSMYGHIYKLAQAIQEGAKKQGQVDVHLFQVPETVPQEILDRSGAPPKPDLPLITPDKLEEADGILFGFPTRFGTIPAQLKDFIDKCGQLWAKGGLVGKLAGTFTSTQGQHSGQETTIFTFLTVLTHFGLIYVPNGYSTPLIYEDQEIMGGSPWGSSVIAVKTGVQSPSDKELEIGRIQGENFAKYLAKFNGLPITSNLNKELEVSKIKDEPTKQPIKVVTQKVETKKPSGFKGLLKRLSLSS